MTRIPKTLLIVVIALQLASLAHAEEILARRYPIPEHGILEVPVPKSWRDEVLRVAPNLPPTLIIRPDAGKEFAVTITPLWNTGNVKDFNSDKKIRDAIDVVRRQVAPSAVEDELVLHRVQGLEAHGYYFMATDKAPKPGEWKYLVCATVATRDLLIGITVLSNKKESEAMAAALAMSRDLRQLNSTSAVDLRYPPGIPREDTYVPPTHEQKMWALATCAVLTQSNKRRHDLLGGCHRTPTEIEALDVMLTRWWGIRSRIDLLESLQWIEEGGHRKEFDYIGAYVASLSPEQLATVRRELGPDRDMRNKIDIVSRYYHLFGTKSIVAWDYSRYVSLCGWGYVLGYLSEDEAWERIMPVARLFQQTFDSWEDLGNNHVVGRQFWSHQQTLERGVLTKRSYYKLCTSPASPWNKIPWDLDLTPPQHRQNKDSEAETARVVSKKSSEWENEHRW